MPCLFDPITCERRETTYELLSGMTGNSVATLMSYKCRKRKIKSINCYLIDENTHFKELQSFLESEKLELEIWRDIDGSTNNWQVSNYGRFRYKWGENWRFAIISLHKKSNRLHMRIHIDGKRGTYQPHMLVAKYFLDKPKDGLVLRHIDGNRWNNRNDNLEYVSRQWLGKNTGCLSKSIQVLKLDPITGEILGEYKSMREASRKNYLCHEAVAQSIREKRLCAGYKYVITGSELDVF